MSSKLIHQQKEFFSKMVVDAVMMLDDLLPLNMIGIKKVQGGALEDTVLVPGVAFKKTFSYAGFEMQRKAYKNPKIALLNIELELKAEKDNAEVSDSAGVRVRFSSTWGNWHWFALNFFVVFYEFFFLLFFWFFLFLTGYS
jgi:chaperonin GroEL (HSP60 family)